MGLVECCGVYFKFISLSSKTFHEEHAQRHLVPFTAILCFIWHDDIIHLMEREFSPNEDVHWVNNSLECIHISWLWPGAVFKQVPPCCLCSVQRSWFMVWDQLWVKGRMCYMYYMTVNGRFYFCIFRFIFWKKKSYVYQFDQNTVKAVILYIMLNTFWKIMYGH